MSEFTDLKAVRHYFGITQAELAGWLGVKRARLSQAESSTQRPLPLRAAAQLTQLTLAVARQPLPVVPEIPAAFLASLRARESECRFQAQRLGLHLRDLQAQAQPLQQRLAELPTVLAALPPGPAHDLRRRWLQRLIDEAADELAATCGPLPQVLLAARLAAWQLEADILAEYGL